MIAYVGNNYEKIIKKRFNFSAFFFSIMYMLYRKMYVYSIVLMIISYIVLLLSVIGDIYVFILVFVIGFMFNKVYVSYVKKQIELIKRNNANCGEIELINICKSKGGTSIGMMILILIIWMFVVSILG